jgi:RNA polymerase sigma-70 factor (ECF subfamily)
MPSIRDPEVQRRMLECLDGLCAYARRQALDPERAEDLAHEAVARVLRRAPDFASPNEVRPYLFRTLDNLCIDAKRRGNRGPQIVSFDELREGAGDFVSAQPERDAPDARLVREALSEDVEEALDQLDEGCRRVLWLREVEDFSYAEIADALDIPLGTVRSRLSRARQFMAQCLASRRPAAEAAKRVQE